MANSKGLLSQGAYIAVTFLITTSVAFAATGKTITRSTGSFVTDGFTVGMKIETGSGSNPGPFTITNVTSTVLTVTETVVDQSAASQVITAFVPVGEVLSLSTPAGEPAEIDMTHLRSSSREFRNGMRDEGSIDGEMNFVPNDPGQLILAQMQNEKTPRTVRIVIPPVNDGGQSLPGYQWTFSGLGRGMPVNLAVDDKAARSFTIRVTGGVTEELLSA